MRVVPGPFPHRSRAALVVLLAGMLLVLSSQARPRLPDWLVEAMERPVPATIEAGAVVLEHWAEIRHQSRQRLETSRRFAVRIDDREHRSWAVLRIPMASDDVKIKGFKAWMIYPSGRVEEFNDRDTFDFADDLESLYSEAKFRILNREASVRPGCVFAYEYETRRKTVFLQHGWSFQSPLPVLRSRVAFDLPDDWTAEATFLSGEASAVRRVGQGWAWEAGPLEGIPVEPDQPPPGQIYLRMGVTVHPTDRDRERYDYLAFGSWQDVARYAERIQQPAVQATPEIVATAQSLRGKNDWETIQAICAYAQSLNYVSVAMDLDKGGGIRPRNASEVFSKHWGDCKDMTALTRAMLGAVGIKTSSVFAQIGEDIYVPENWPAPHSFNHCIVGIHWEGAAHHPAIVRDPSLGKVLLFDPTQRFVPVGKLPATLYGGRVLIGHARVEGLVGLPVPQPQDLRIARRVTAALNATGRLEGEIEEEATGAVAAYLRWLVRTSGETELENTLRDWLEKGISAPEVEAVTFEDDFAADRVELKIRFSAPHFTRTFDGGRMASFRPVFIPVPNWIPWVPPAEEERKTAYLLRARSIAEEFEFTLPEEAEVEFLPEAVQSGGDFGNYALEVDVEGGVLRVNRRYACPSRRVGPSEYEALVAFYDEISRAEGSQVVLRFE